MTSISRRADAVGHFLVMEVLERAQALEARGVDVVHLEVGEPDFTPPTQAVAAGAEAVMQGKTRYTHSLGIPELRTAIANNLNQECGTAVEMEQVVVTTGSSAGLLLAIASLCEPGENICAADPGYPCYANIARTLGVETRHVPVSAETGWQMSSKSVAEASDAATRAVVLNTPSNPTGAVAQAETFTDLLASGFPLISDEVYRGISYEGRSRSALEFEGDKFVVGGFSKRHAMTGWRIGWLIAPDSHLRAIQAIQQNVYLCAPHAGQLAALAAISADSELEEMRKTYQRRRDLLCDGLTGLGFRIATRPAGAFYVFVDARWLGADSLTLCYRILDEAAVACTPGIDFGPGGEGWLRFSYATSEERITEGLSRLQDWIRSQ